MSFLSLHGRVFILLFSLYRGTQVNTLSLVFVNIKPQKDYLNMNSACLCVNEWRRHAVLFTTEACDASGDINVCISLNEDINT